ncbi:ParB/RepB/Spo0J family partition protein [Ketogulonicigenium vulgare]|uniref:ParB-like protein nuclease n=1 Tax=Ketogulonicigenium vulgare (strain WSH-001) TaxID=759362 RepID=F9YB80_KETVW|nr:ParB/RepB/Spo0J family partition protein [Ketogulonicigenium vulgare]ADO44108.1 ParB-like nuclease [Ketogulonicigenium vulgare Y25]AEM42632.1 ParB-like protein nuclease [Ketogulonicigenium vulgare WSH-001]ALJ82439.1 chromosome partitioning protein ParB [Ketogulonicigenium vulgare]ANW35226.1 chromosome partitioning protein ParB [Ketogulonicigenium vulgare]AOZ53334.1 ParB-like nuclease [Ketogulonicigenium vulgare]
MAKRRTLGMPSSEELQRIEAEFSQSRPTAARPAVPIAQVAAEAAAAGSALSVDDRITAARDRVDAAALRIAQDKGLVMIELPLDQIDADVLVRDRVALDADELDELQSSIAKNGLRLPVEVFPLEGGGYGLLSGYRRLMALRALQARHRDPAYDQIKAVLRDPAAMGGTFAAMVEENEIRSNLSHYERGRIAVIAAQQGAFTNVEAAVNALFPVASKAKRSKIRSFALIFEELGDLLRFPDQIKEREGLRLAQILRDGGEARLRDAIGSRVAASAEDEARLIAALLDHADTPATDSRKGGRPRKDEGQGLVLPSGHTVKTQMGQNGWTIRLEGGRTVSQEMIDQILREIGRVLDR